VNPLKIKISVKICVKTKKYTNYSFNLLIMYGAPTCFGITLPSSGSVPSAIWEMLIWGVVYRMLWMGVLCLVTWCAVRTMSLYTRICTYIYDISRLRFNGFGPACTFWYHSVFQLVAWHKHFSVVKDISCLYPCRPYRTLLDLTQRYFHTNLTDLWNSVDIRNAQAAHGHLVYVQSDSEQYGPVIGMRQLFVKVCPDV
jgi:hypothetical protein